jgi:hypothetical protein
LANTYVMLASTVQFSRYGRSRLSRARCRALQPVLTEGAQRPFPQDPTACSASGPPATAFHPARRAY